MVKDFITLAKIGRINNLKMKTRLFLFMLMFVFLCHAKSTQYWPIDVVINRSYYGINGYLPYSYEYYDSFNNTIKNVTFESFNTMRLTTNYGNIWNQDPSFSAYLRVKYHIIGCRKLFVDGNLYSELELNKCGYRIVIDDYVSSNYSQDAITSFIESDNVSRLPNIGDTLFLSSDFKKLTIHNTNYIQHEKNISASYLLENCHSCFSSQVRPRMMYYGSDTDNGGIDVCRIQKFFQNDEFETIIINNNGNDTCLLWFSQLNPNADKKMIIMPKGKSAERVKESFDVFTCIYNSFANCKHNDDVIKEELCEDFPVKLIFPGESFEINAARTLLKSYSILDFMRLYDNYGLSVLHDCVYKDCEYNDSEMTEINDAVHKIYHNIDKAKLNTFCQSNLIIEGK